VAPGCNAGASLAFRSANEMRRPVPAHQRVSGTLLLTTMAVACSRSPAATLLGLTAAALALTARRRSCPHGPMLKIWPPSLSISSDSRY
jgi:hypothetical protein